MNVSIQVLEGSIYLQMIRVIQIKPKLELFDILSCHNHTSRYTTLISDYCFTTCFSALYLRRSVIRPDCCNLKQHRYNDPCHKFLCCILYYGILFLSSFFFRECDSVYASADTAYNMRHLGNVVRCENPVNYLLTQIQNHHYN